MFKRAADDAEESIESQTRQLIIDLLKTNI